MKCIFIVLIATSFGCNQLSLFDQKINTSKDFVVIKYLTLVESKRPHDTNSFDYKILKAYIKNDSGFFAKLNRRIDQDFMFMKGWAVFDSCVHLPKLSDLNVDEAYRFSHSQSFCPYAQKITITRSDSTVRLFYVEFSNGYGDQFLYENRKGAFSVIKPYCTIVREFDRVLSMKEWEEFDRKVNNADYWGLISKDHSLSTDGSDWQIDAFSNEQNSYINQQIRSVSRQCNCNAVFEDMGRYLLQLAEQTTMCNDFF